MLLTLVGFKYQGSATNLFKDHSLSTSLFIADIIVYVIAFMKNASSSTTSTSNIYLYIFLISGAIGCELLLFILVTLIRWFMINIFVLIFFEALRRRLHRHIAELHAATYLIQSMFEPLYRNGSYMITRLYEWGQQVFSMLYPLTRDMRIYEVGSYMSTTLCNDVLHYSSLNYYLENSWFQRINYYGPFSSTGEISQLEHEAGGGDVQMCDMV